MKFPSIYAIKTIVTNREPFTPKQQWRILMCFTACSVGLNVFLFAITPGISTEPNEIGLTRACLNKQVTNPHARITGPQLRQLKSIAPYSPDGNQQVQMLLGVSSYCRIPDGTAQVNGQEIKVSRYASPTIWDRNRAIALQFDLNNQKFVGIQELNFFELAPVHADEASKRTNLAALWKQRRARTLGLRNQEGRQVRGWLKSLFGARPRQSSSCH